MESNTSLLFEMRMLNDLRKLKPEQRKELIETLEREELLEEEALKKNPNLHVENKLAQVLGELKDLRAEMAVLRNSCQENANSSAIARTNNRCFAVCSLADKCQLARGQERTLEDDSSEYGDCPLFSGSIDWWPIIIFVFVFLTLLSLPGGKSRPNPITI